MTIEEEKAKTWANVFFFIAHEWFGEEFVAELSNYKYEGEPIQEGERVINVGLYDHEKIFWNLCDSLFAYLRKNRKKLPAGELGEKLKMANSFKSQFWAMIQLNHPEFMEPDAIGIRKGYSVVERPSPITENNPLMQLLKGGFPN